MSIFIYVNKDKILRIRVTTQQLERLMSIVLKYKFSTMSDFVRKAIVDKINKIEINGKRKR